MNTRNTVASANLEQALKFLQEARAAKRDGKTQVIEECRKLALSIMENAREEDDNETVRAVLFLMRLGQWKEARKALEAFMTPLEVTEAPDKVPDSSAAHPVVDVDSLPLQKAVDRHFAQYASHKKHSKRGPMPTLQPAEMSAIYAMAEYWRRKSRRQDTNLSPFSASALEMAVFGVLALSSKKGLPLSYKDIAEQLNRKVVAVRSAIKNLRANTALRQRGYSISKSLQLKKWKEDAVELFPSDGETAATERPPETEGTA